MKEWAEEEQLSVEVSVGPILGRMDLVEAVASAEMVHTDWQAAVVLGRMSLVAVVR